MVHSTAVIHPKAQIGAGCEIGPYCVIGEHVELGPGCRLHSHVVIDGHTRLGQGNEIFPFASIGLRTQDLKWKGGLTRTEIGDHNTIRECVTIHSATGEGEATVIGSHNNILASSHIGHNVVIGNHVIMSMAGAGGARGGGGLCAGGRHGGGAPVLPHRQDVHRWRVLPQSCRMCRPSCSWRAIRRRPARSTRSAWSATACRPKPRRRCEQAYKILFRDGLTTSNALARIEQELPPLPEIQHLVQFVRTSERGITK